MAKIALFLCLIASVCLFIYDSKKHKKVSLDLWLPVIWAMYTASKALYYWLNPVPEVAVENDYSAGSPVDRNFLTIIMFLGIISLARRKIDWNLLLKNNIWVFIFFVYLLISVSWSNYIDISFKRFFRGVGYFIMGLIIITEEDPLESLMCVFKRSAYLLIPLSIVLIKYYRLIGVAYTLDGTTEMWVGVTTHKNSLGILACLSFIFFLYDLILYWKKRKFFPDNFISLAFIFMCLYLINGSETNRSSTSLGCSILAVFLFIGTSIFKDKIKKIRKVIFIVIVSYLLLQYFFGFFFSDSLFTIIVTSFGKDATLTGRTPLWEELIRMGSKRYFFGSGYDSFWLGDTMKYLWEIFIWKPTQPHNGYIDIFLNLGIVGLIIFIILLFGTYRKIENIFINDFFYGRLLITFFVVILIYNITEALFMPAGIISFLFLSIIMVIPRNEQVKVVEKSVLEEKKLKI